MVEQEMDSRRLAYQLEELKLEIVDRILLSDRVHPTTRAPQDWSAAADLALWCRIVKLEM